MAFSVPGSNFLAADEHLPGCTQGALVKETMKCLGYSSISVSTNGYRDREHVKPEPEFTCVVF